VRSDISAWRAKRNFQFAIHIAQREALEPRGKAASPDEIAHAVSFLASPQTHFITGQTLFVDGGKSLGGLSI